MERRRDITLITEQKGPSLSKKKHARTHSRKVVFGPTSLNFFVMLLMGSNGLGRQATPPSQQDVLVRPSHSEQYASSNTNRLRVFFRVMNRWLHCMATQVPSRQAPRSTEIMWEVKKGRTSSTEDLTATTGMSAPER